MGTIAFPIGGIGTGSISLGGRGQLRDWEIFNRPDKGNSPAYAFASIWAQLDGQKPLARVLEGRFQPPYEGRGSGLGWESCPGWPRFESAVFTGEYPFASIEFNDSTFPVRAQLEAFNPLIPLDPGASSLPVAVLRYRIHNPHTRDAKVAVAFSLENPVGETGRTNEYRETDELKGLFMQNPFLAATDPLRGSFALCTTPDSGQVSYLEGWRGYGFWVAPMTFWQDFSDDGALDPYLHPGPNRVGAICVRSQVPAQGMKLFTFILGWHFPNRTPKRCGWNHAPKGDEDAPIGNLYTKRFSDAWQAARHVAAHLPELEKDSREFVDTLKQTTLPPAVLDAALSNLSTLKTNTFFQTEDGRFHAFEGCGDTSGCCAGSCTHVLNYEGGLEYLFPTLSRSLRESEFGYATDEVGRMDFRYKLPYGKERFGYAAADGQMGTLIKLYLDWRLSGDTPWLQRVWPKAKKALEFAWIPGGWDADRDGVMEGAQHTTFDVEFYGPNPLCSVWYLGALRACEEMARVVGDNAAATEYRRLFEKGRAWIDSNLFNGEFYIQKIQGRPASQIADGLRIGAGSVDTEDPDFQLGAACLTDQLVGQYFAHVAGLGYLLDRSHITRTLNSIFRYNFKPDLRLQEVFSRTYAVNDEAGTVICHYPNWPRRKIPLAGASEIWTGSEYQLAAHMFSEGMFEHGLTLVGAVRRRHDGERRNPWNEPECGHHYVRALSSWSCILALCGFHYTASEGTVILKPRMKRSSVRGFWCVPTGWGGFRYDSNSRAATAEIAARHGKLVCRRIKLDTLGRPQPSTVKAQLGTEAVLAELLSSPDEVTVQLAYPVKVQPRKNLRIRVT